METLVAIYDKVAVVIYWILGIWWAGLLGCFALVFGLTSLTSDHDRITYYMNYNNEEYKKKRMNTFGNYILAIVLSLVATPIILYCVYFLGQYLSEQIQH